MNLKNLVREAMRVASQKKIQRNTHTGFRKNKRNELRKSKKEKGLNLRNEKSRKNFKGKKMKLSKKSLAKRANKSLIRAKSQDPHHQRRLKRTRRITSLNKQLNLFQQRLKKWQKQSSQKRLRNPTSSKRQLLLKKLFSMTRQSRQNLQRWTWPEAFLMILT